MTNNAPTTAPSFCGGSVMVSFMVMSNCQSPVICSSTFTVMAPPQVVMNCPANTTVDPCLTQAQVNAAYAAWLATATASGGCGGVLTINAPPAPTICNATSVTRTVTFTYTNSCAPFTTTCTATFSLPAYPDFTVPSNGAGTVACVAQATQPVPPAVLNGCGSLITPTGPSIVNNPNPLSCEGTRTYTWTYTDCAGHAKTWSYIYTIEYQSFSLPANASLTVACPDDTEVVPTAPIVTDNCDVPLTPMMSSTAKPVCESSRVYSFVYTDCEGNTATWTYTYMVEYLDFVLPASEAYTVECPSQALLPMPPVVLDNCGELAQSAGPFISSTYDQYECESSRSYLWTFEDCEGNQHDWSVRYNFSYTADFTILADIENTVACEAAAVVPVPPTVYDMCNNEVAVKLASVVEEIGASGCSGYRIYTFVYNDCGGHEHLWTVTYHIIDNEAPTGEIPDVDERELNCVADVPCPDYDFSSKIDEIVSKGKFRDNCSDVLVTLEKWTDFWQCSDADSDGEYTFGRTFFFRIADECGNAFTSPIPVTYSGACEPICTFTQNAWGNEGDAPGSLQSMTDEALIQSLLSNYGPLKIGGDNRSLTLTEAKCIQNMLPGAGGPSRLANCHQTNCLGCNPTTEGRLKNSLAANTISLMLNVRYNAQYNGMSIQEVLSESLECIEIESNLYGNDPTVIPLQLFIADANGTFYYYPYTIGGLLDLTNRFLDGKMQLSPGQQTLLSKIINLSVNNVNAYLSNCEVRTACEGDGFAGAVTGNRLAVFTAELDGNNVDLSWSLADIENVERFTVERSVNEDEYSLMEYVKPSSNVGLLTYVAADNNPAPGMNFYRLLVESRDGEVDALFAQVDYRPTELQYGFHPNPAEDFVTFTLAKEESIKGVSLEIFDSKGQQVYFKSFGQVGGVVERIDTKDFTSGLYLTRITVGTDRYEAKLVIFN
jgi:Secretion system C-terminal sorting domain